MSDKNTNAPGAISRTFPLYDGHGNTMAELVRTSPTSADFVQGSLRKYDAWGNSRLNSAPSGFHGYCGNLGHKEDPESGLTYMRARYYEPGTGRFISQDPARDGRNWYGYCGGNPVDRVDPTGRVWAQILGLMAIGAIFGLLTYAIQKGVSGDPWTWQGAAGYTLVGAVALPLIGLLGAVIAAKGAAVTAIALGEVLLWEVVAGVLNLAVTGIQAGIDKQEDERLERRGMKGGVDTAIAASLGQQMLILMYLGDIE